MLLVIPMDRTKSESVGEHPRSSTAMSKDFEISLDAVDIGIQLRIFDIRNEHVGR